MTSSNSQSPSPFTLLFIIALASAVPTVFTFQNIYSASGGDWLRSCIFAGIVWIIASITLKVITQIIDVFVSQVVSKIINYISYLSTGYQSKYYQNLFYKHRNLDLGGLSTQGEFNVEVESVFIELRMLVEVPNRASTGVIFPSADKANDGIWSHLRNRKAGNLVILGYPGAGKTTVLKHITLVLINNAKRRKARIPNWVPIIIFLRDHGKDIQDNSPSLTDIIVYSLDKKIDQAPQKWFDIKLREGKCLVMFDGLDEISPIEQRQAVIKWVDDQIAKYSRNRFILTSRPLGYQKNTSKQIDTPLEIRPFSAVQQERFIRKWYLVNEIKREGGKNDPGVRMEADRGSDDIIERIRKSAILSDLAKNPLLLTMMVTIHRNKYVLPDKRVKLYAQMCEVFLGNRWEAKRIHMDIDQTQCQRVLQELAFGMMRNRLTIIDLPTAEDMLQSAVELVSWQGSVSEFLKMIEQRSGLLVEHSPQVFAFAHKTIQEYLASAHIKKNMLEHFLIHIIVDEDIRDEWWHETIRLYCADVEATKIVEACLNSRHRSSGLALALECSQEASATTKEARKKLDDLFKNDVESSDRKTQQMVAEAMLTTNLRHMIPVKEDTFISERYVTNAEYQLFVDAAARRNIFRQPYHWKNTRFPSGTYNHPVEGIEPEDSLGFCEWLTYQDDKKEWLYRLPNFKEAIRQDIDSLNKGFWANEADEYRLISLQENKYQIKPSKMILEETIPLLINAVNYRTLFYQWGYATCAYALALILTKLLTVEKLVSIDRETDTIAAIQKILIRLTLNHPPILERIEEARIQIDNINKYRKQDIDTAISVSNSLVGILSSLSTTVTEYIGGIEPDFDIGNVQNQASNMIHTNEHTIDLIGATTLALEIINNLGRGMNNADAIHRGRTIATIISYGDIMLRINELSDVLTEIASQPALAIQKMRNTRSNFWHYLGLFIEINNVLEWMTNLLKYKMTEQQHQRTRPRKSAELSPLEYRYKQYQDGLQKYQQLLARWKGEIVSFGTIIVIKERREIAED